MDYLVSNAGLLIENKVAAMTADEWDAALRVNLSAPFYLARPPVVAPMTAQGFGRIVNVGSVTAAMGNPVEAGYGAAKAGLLGLTRSLARAWPARASPVNLVVPACSRPEIDRLDAAGGARGDPRDDPLGRRGDPRELAAAVRFLRVRRGERARHPLGGDRGRRPEHGRLTMGQEVSVVAGAARDTGRRRLPARHVTPVS